MDISELLGLPYPETDDPQALALYMQDLAWKLEDLLTQVQASTTAFTNRPAAYWQNSGEAFGANTSIDIDWDLAAPLGYRGSVSQVGAPASQPRFPEARAGLWLIGMSAVSFTYTTPNAGTYRRARVFAQGFGQTFATLPFTGPRVTTDNSSVSLNDVAAQSYESNTGAPGSPMTTMALAWIPPDAVLDPTTGSIGRIGAQVGGGNTSSGGTLTAGTAFLWAIWLGDGTQQIVQV